jgi:ADP-heptose:LPS heptosyltransferase/2-polyprenyl-3-methyl-5-hydroxy-6-metoxy-1,4-benzoquinol methylase
MPTADRRGFVAQAIRCFLAQDYPERELLIVDDGADAVADLVPDDDRLRYLRLEGRRPVGTKRNFGCQQARGDIIVHWDDDDWNAPWRLRSQVEELLANQADICGLGRVLFYGPQQQRAWEYVYPAGHRRWVYGASLCYTKKFWQAHPFPEIKVGEDTRFVWADARAKIHVQQDPRFLVALVHRSNTSPKRTSDSRYQPKPVGEIEALLGEDAQFYRGLGTAAIAAPPAVKNGMPKTTNPSIAVPGQTAKRRALITASRGIGDILRVTPLIRVAHQLGYEVDVLLETDYPEVAQLFCGAPEIRRLFQRPSRRPRSAHNDLKELASQAHDVATFTFWSAGLRSHVHAKRIHQFDRAKWLAEGDTRCVERIARELGWQGPLPAPFAMASPRQFQLPPGTVAIHAGCKYEWPWKKWHGFDELARRFASVVIVGSEEDQRTDNTYFRRGFKWPAHAQDFIGKLNLADTAALLRECAALISNDSGLMHLGVALGVPTFGIFGITSPQREAIDAPNFFPITKGLPCETACRRGAWGRRDCDRHLECLKTLTAEEVFMKVSQLISEISAKTPRANRVRIASPPESTPTVEKETINVMYYGWVFDSSGYGNAARGYIHALHQAGVNLSVVDLAGRPRQVAEPLVESLVGRKIEADFHLFHGIPPHWSRQAFPLRNVIAMTVWETDTMPPQWRPVLNHAVEVWLPSEFNTTVFARALERPVFKLPHVWMPSAAALSAAASPEWGIQQDDFVFYSIFEWQDRKGPREMIEAFLRAFPATRNVVLVLKSNPGAAGAAKTALAEVRQRVNSEARVEICCEGWSDQQIAALQERGNCYVSLHRGEGWNLPLFDAASRGKPVIATGYSGPLEFLDATAQSLVRYQLGPVRQRYAYYVPSMRWAEPELAHASELMQRVWSERDAMTRRAAAHAEKLRSTFSLERVGGAAHQRLMHLLRRFNPAKWQRLHTAERQARLRPSVPIPGDWYDADYFDHGVKSNWVDGYKWDAFAGLFRETAEFLTEQFADARTFLDAGCSKGFLVRALREAGKECRGFDHSRWAIDHAEEMARPYLWQAGVDDVELKETNDVLLAFSLFEGLTEEQALRFLERMRPFTRQALLAVIQTAENQPPDSVAASDQDLSHITLRARSWWNELFFRAGWRQDALHRLAERTCQAHRLPMRMGWSVFVYAP